LDRGLGKPQNRSGLSGEEKIILTVGNRAPAVQAVTISTKLSHLLLNTSTNNYFFKIIFYREYFRANRTNVIKRFKRSKFPGSLPSGEKSSDVLVVMVKDSEYGQLGRNMSLTHSWS
jgi:hypothetical protein